MPDPDLFEQGVVETSTGPAESLLNPDNDTSLGNRLEGEDFTQGKVELPVKWFESVYPDKGVYIGDITERMVEEELSNLLSAGLQTIKTYKTLHSENNQNHTDLENILNETFLDPSYFNARVVGAKRPEKDSEPDIHARIIAEVFPSENTPNYFDMEKIAYDSRLRFRTHDNWRLNVEEQELFHYNSGETIRGESIEDLLITGLSLVSSTTPEHVTNNKEPEYTGRIRMKYSD